MLVRNVNRRQTMMDRLTNPYALGIYTGAAATGMITGMVAMARRQGNERLVSSLRRSVDASFGWSGRRPDQEEQKRQASSYRRRSKTGKISIVSKASSSNPFPIVRDWEDVKKDPLGIAPMVRYSKRLQLISSGNKEAIALNKRDPWGMKAFDEGGM